MLGVAGGRLLPIAAAQGVASVAILAASGRLTGGVPLHSLILTAFLPTLKVVLVAATGYVLSHPNIAVLRSGSRHDLSKVIFYVFLPSFIFARLGSSVSLTSLLAWWFIPVNVAIAALAGCSIGLILAWLSGVPADLVPLAAVLTGIGNQGNMPVTLMSAICNQARSPFGNAVTCEESANAYVALGLWMAALIVWGFVHTILAPTKAWLPTHNEDSFPPESSPRLMRSLPSCEQLQRLLTTSSTAPTFPPPQTHPFAYDSPCNSAAPLPPFVLCHSLATPFSPGTKGQAPVHRHLPAYPQPLLPPPAAGGICPASSPKMMKKSASAHWLLPRIGVHSIVERDEEGHWAFPQTRLSRHKSHDLLTMNRGTSGGESLTLAVLPSFRIWLQVFPDGLADEFSRIFEGMAQAAWNIMRPPVIAATVAVLLGIQPQLHRTFFAPSGSLRWIADVADTLGSGLIPCILICIGGNIARPESESAACRIPPRAHAAIVAARLLVMPFIGMGVVLTAQRWGWIPLDNHLLTFVLLLQHSMPASVEIGTCCSLHKHGEREAAAILFHQHVAGILTVTCCLFAYLFILFR